MRQFHCTEANMKNGKNSSPVQDCGVPKVNRLLRAERIRLFFLIRFFSDFKAAMGLIRMLGIDHRYVVFENNHKFGKVGSQEINPVSTSAAFPFYSPDWLTVRFYDNELPGFRRDELVLNREPYKTFFHESFSSGEKSVLRQAMRAENRKIIVCCSPTGEEVTVILKAYQKLRLPEKPLLILGLSELNRSLKGSLVKRGFKVTNRTRCTQNLLSFGSSDIVILSTMGELFKFLKAADLAIVGHDRNLFEPAVLGVPILYFKEPLKMTEKERWIVASFGLIWRKNKVAKKLLDETGGAVSINPTLLHEQMVEALRNPYVLRQGAQAAVQRFNREIIPQARRYGSGLLAAGIRAKRSPLRIDEKLEQC